MNVYSPVSGASTLPAHRAENSLASKSFSAGALTPKSNVTSGSVRSMSRCPWLRFLKYSPFKPRTPSHFVLLPRKLPITSATAFRCWATVSRANSARTGLFFSRAAAE